MNQINLHLVNQWITIIAAWLHTQRPAFSTKEVAKTILLLPSHSALMPSIRVTEWAAQRSIGTVVLNPNENSVCVKSSKVSTFII